MAAKSFFLRFRDRRLPPSKASNPPQRLEPAPAPKPPQPLQPVPLNSPNEKLLHPRAARCFPNCSKTLRLEPAPLKAPNLRSGLRLPPLKLQTSAAARACPPQKPRTAAVPPSTSDSSGRAGCLAPMLGGPKVLSYGFEPAPLESFKSSAAPRACPPQRLAPALLKSLKPPRSAPSSVASTQAMSLVPLRAASSGPALRGLSGCDRVPAASSGSSSLLPVAFHIAPNPSQRLQRLAPALFKSLKPPPCLHPRAAGWPQNLFLRFRDRRLPPSKASNPPQRLEPAPAPKPPQRLQPVPLNSPNEKLLHPRAARCFPNCSKTLRLEPAPLKAPNLRSGLRLPPSKPSHASLQRPVATRGVSRPFQQAAASSTISSQQLFVTVPRLPPAPLKTLPRFPAASSSEPAVWPLPNLSSLLYSQCPVVDSSQQLFLTVPRLPPAPLKTLPRFPAASSGLSSRTFPATRFFLRFRACRLGLPPARLSGVATRQACS